MDGDDSLHSNGDDNQQRCLCFSFFESASSFNVQRSTSPFWGILALPSSAPRLNDSRLIMSHSLQPPTRHPLRLWLMLLAVPMPKYQTTGQRKGDEELERSTQARPNSHRQAKAKPIVGNCETRNPYKERPKRETRVSLQLTYDSDSIARTAQTTRSLVPCGTSPILGEPVTAIYINSL